MYVTRPEGSASSSTRVHPTTTATSDPYQTDLHTLQLIETLTACGVDGNGMEKIPLELNSVVRQMCAMGVDVFEIYSPPRVVALAKRYGLRGFSLDRTTQDEKGNPWDFEDPEQGCESEGIGVGNQAVVVDRFSTMHVLQHSAKLDPRENESGAS